MAIILPTRTDSPLYTFGVELDGVTYLLTFRWNDREAAWFFDLADSDGDPLMSGRKVTIGTALLARFRTPGLPPGELEAIDTTGAQVEAGFDELGARVQLVYFAASELPASYVIAG